MEEIIKEIHWLCQMQGFSGEHAAELMKIQELRRIGNMLSVIETDLSELLDIVREDHGGKMAAEELELNKLMETMGIIGGRK